MADLCLFCGSGGTLTNEHVWPDWFSTEFSGLVVPTEQIAHSDDFGTREYIAPPFQQTVKIVCSECNSGWMSDLESPARPTLRRIIRGESISLGPARQQALATWAMKTAIVAEHVLLGPKHIPTTHHHELYATREPPKGVVMWTGTHTPRRLESGAVMAFEVRKQPVTPVDGCPPDDARRIIQSNSYGMTLGMGLSAIQILGTADPDMLFIPPTEDLTDRVRQLWPPRTRYRWPPPKSLDGVGGLVELPRFFIGGRP